MPFVETRFISPTTLTTSAASALYTVPTGYSAIIKQLVVTNITGTAATFTFYIGAASAGNALFSGTSVAANDTVIINLSQVLSTGEILRALASTGSALNLTVSGVLNDGPLASTATVIVDNAITVNKIADSAVTSAKIADGAIVNADINASAAIDQSKIASLTSDLALKAPLASPTLTGTPLAPTATAGTNTTQIATMASKPWNTAWGQVGYVSRTTGDLSIAGATQDLTSMSITFTGIAGRLYKASWLVNGSKNATDRDGTKVSFANSSNTDLAAVNLVTMGGTNIGLNFSGVATFTSTGSASFKLRAMSFSGTMTVFATSTNPMFFIIEDIGPA